MVPTMKACYERSTDPKRSLQEAKSIAELSIQGCGKDTKSKGQKQTPGFMQD